MVYVLQDTEWVKSGIFLAHWVCGCIRMLVCYRAVVSESDELHFLSVRALYVSVCHAATRLWRWDSQTAVDTHTKKIWSDYINTSHFSFVLLSSLYSFSHSLFLSEHHLEADEGEEVVLDCFLPWHALVVGQTEYHYSWHPAEKNVHEHRQTNTFAVFKESRSHFRQLQKYTVVYFLKRILVMVKIHFKRI